MFSKNFSTCFLMLNAKSYFLLLLLTATSISHAACLSTQQLNQLQQQFNSTLKKAIKTPTAPGITVAIHSDKYCIDLQMAQGVSNIAKGTPLTPKHSFRIASNTKTYTAVAVMRLVELGKLKLDQTVAALLPIEFIATLKDSGHEPEKITIHHLLTHTSGMADHAQDHRYLESIMKDPNHQWSPLEQVKLLKEYQLKPGLPGEKFAYSDTGYILLAQIIAGQTGKPFAKALRDLLNYKALGLSKTWLERSETPPGNLPERAHQYIGELDTWWWNPSLDLHGGGGIVTTAQELGLFLRALLTGMVLEKPESLNTMMQWQDNSLHEGYGMGLFKMQLDDKQGVGHTGFWNSFAFYIEDYELTIAGAITNAEGIKGTKLTGLLLNDLRQTIEKTE